MFPCDLPARISSRAVGMSQHFNQYVDLCLKRPSLRHGRSVSTMLPDGQALSIKGCGWSLGPPWVQLSEKDPELCFGLMDAESAKREIAVSSWLEAQGIEAARSREYVPLQPDELIELGVNTGIRFSNGRAVEPVALFTTAPSSYRVADLYSDAGRDALVDLYRTSGEEDAREVFDSFCTRLVTAVVSYQRLGAVNDTLNVENVTVSGHVTDFEWFYVPGIPTPDGSTTERLEVRQRKEGIYLAELLLHVGTCLGASTTLASVARRAIQHAQALGDISGMPPVIQQLQELATAKTR